LDECEVDLSLTGPNLLVVRLSSGPIFESNLRFIGLNLGMPSQEDYEAWLNELRAQEVIWDPDLARVQHLQNLGFPAQLLNPAATRNRWLERVEALDKTIWASTLGLPPPEGSSIIILGWAGSEWDRALTIESRNDHNSCFSSFCYFPGWPELMCSSLSEAWALAGWLYAALSVAYAVAWVQDDLDLLQMSMEWMRARQLCIQPPIVPADLHAILSGKPLVAFAEDRPCPHSQQLFHWEKSSSPALVSVLISLYNYSSEILNALESVAAQSIDLELIVVDDASTDDGSAVVKDWMQSKVDSPDSIFKRLILLRHHINSGLAVARNTAFSRAKAAWCFILDADNILLPRAVEECLALAELGSERLGVVHPILAVHASPGRTDDQRSLVSTASWQKQRMRTGNVVDAMALVRRSAWEDVGGYTHIEGGWEDFDFWCKLIEANYHGIQCPKLLAVYNSHEGSMSHRFTNRSWRALSQCLQQRHPWLQLPLAL
jgi:GT2 family glycosyltransferase